MLISVIKLGHVQKGESGLAHIWHHIALVYVNICTSHFLGHTPADQPTEANCLEKGCLDFCKLQLNGCFNLKTSKYLEQFVYLGRPWKNIDFQQVVIPSQAFVLDLVRS